MENLSIMDLSDNNLCIPADYPNLANPLHVFLEEKDPYWFEYQDPSLCPICFLPLIDR
jgi:hypothetical protein